MRTNDLPVDVSVVVPARDVAEVIGQQLEALVRQRWDRGWEVVVVDNGSSDRTTDVARSFSDRLPLRVVHAAAGTGPGYARNAGARSAVGQSLVFCDADDVVSDGWLAAVGEALREHDFVTGPLDFQRLNPAWMADARGHEFARERPLFDGIFPYAPSCNVGIRASVFERVGGFDPTLEVGEDLELSLRLWLSDVELHFEPAAVVHYRFRPTLSSTFHQARSYGRARPMIGERLRESGREAPRRRAGLRNWAWLARRAPLLRSRAGRARWMWVAGNRIGNLEGSLRARRLYL